MSTRSLSQLLSDKALHKIVKCLSLSYVGLHPSIVAFNYVRHGLTRECYLDVLDVIRKGDIVLTKHKGCLANYVNSGRVTHAGIYVGNEVDSRFLHGVVQAVDPRVMVQELSSVMCCDYMEIWRPKCDILPEDMEHVYTFLKDILQKQIEYDNRYLSDLTSSDEEANKQLYCSELVVEAYQKLDKKYKLDFNPVDKLGEKVYSPSSFLNPNMGFTMALQIGKKC